MELPNKNMPYKLDSRYFDSMQAQVQDRMNENAQSEEDQDFVSNQKTSSQADADYFQKMQAQVLAKISSNVEVEASPNLISNNPYIQPEGYSPRPRLKKQKVYSMQKQNRFSFISAAATFLFMVFLGSAYIKANQKVTDDNQSLAYINDINTSDWSNYLEEEESIRLDGEGDDPEINLENVSDEEVLDYLQEEQYLELF